MQLRDASSLTGYVAEYGRLLVVVLSAILGIFRNLAHVSLVRYIAPTGFARLATIRMLSVIRSALNRRATSAPDLSLAFSRVLLSSQKVDSIPLG